MLEGLREDPYHWTELPSLNKDYYYYYIVVPSVQSWGTDIVTTLKSQLISILVLMYFLVMISTVTVMTMQIAVPSVQFSNTATSIITTLRSQLVSILVLMYFLAVISECNCDNHADSCIFSSALGYGYCNNYKISIGFGLLFQSVL